MKIKKSSLFAYTISLYLLLAILSIYIQNYFFKWFSDFPGVFLCGILIVELLLMKFTRFGDWIEYD